VFLCQLGSNAQLSLAELKAVLGEDQVTALGQVAALINLPEDTTVQELQDLLGGTVKIAQVFKTLEKIDQAELPTVIEAFLIEKVEENLNFAIAELGRDHLPVIESKTIKQSLVKKTGKSIRYLGTGRTGVGAAVLLHQKKVIEVLVCRDLQGKTYLGETLTVQNIDFWSLRDRGKPAAKHQRGLLPPKVARILLNLSLGQDSLRLSEKQNSYCLLDPFCGVGTIPFEAIDLGFNQVLGSDISQEAIENSFSNLEWFKREFADQVKSDQIINFFLADATQIDQQLEANSVSHLVTETFLGKQTPSLEKIPSIAKGLGKLYLGSFKAWQTILQPGAQLVVIFPRWNQLKQASGWQDLVEKLAHYGYHAKNEPIIYGRPGAEVSREIWQFELKK